MSAALAGLAGFLLVVVVVITTVVALRWRNRVRTQRNVTPEEQYRREVVNIRRKPQTWRDKRAEARRAQHAKRRRKVWAAGTAGAVGGSYYTGVDGSCGGGSSCGGGGGCGGGS
jgi:uncharacterized membrane protein YgcG